MNDIPENDRALIERLNRSLDEAATRPDPALDAALAATRAHIRSGHTGSSRDSARRLRPLLWASGLALAAGLAAVVVIPRAPQPTVPNRQAQVIQAQAIVASPNEDPDMLENMDMLVAMGNDHTRS